MREEEDRHFRPKYTSIHTFGILPLIAWQIIKFIRIIFGIKYFFYSETYSQKSISKKFIIFGIESNYPINLYIILCLEYSCLISYIDYVDYKCIAFEFRMIRFRLITWLHENSSWKPALFCQGPAIINLSAYWRIRNVQIAVGLSIV